MVNHGQSGQFLAPITSLTLCLTFKDISARNWMHLFYKKKKKMFVWPQGPIIAQDMFYKLSNSSVLDESGKWEVKQFLNLKKYIFSSSRNGRDQLLDSGPVPYKQLINWSEQSACARATKMPLYYGLFLSLLSFWALAFLPEGVVRGSMKLCMGS